ncbi:E3 ubiquitin-protein ligase SspH1 (RING-type E3 ubiquitin transferase SspH1) (Salmonella secreted protein H1) (Secreted effector protein SspH1) [Durusdinium trenchii]|uniref:E3 ubiquitin-protein ligase SspH1 (RING-type E3 ubiquitin transferase SspH1) (Salmonella secreted protein H1) (Secreted effector protein SspH1) n=1 Tax=Durusdinium trenchii TaxID=1381693 RepID=A0ABP0J6B8_9DINO
MERWKRSPESGVADAQDVEEVDTLVRKILELKRYRRACKIDAEGNWVLEEEEGGYEPPEWIEQRKLAYALTGGPYGMGMLNVDMLLAGGVTTLAQLKRMSQEEVSEVMGGSMMSFIVFNTLESIHAMLEIPVLELTQVEWLKELPDIEFEVPHLMVQGSRLKKLPSSWTFSADVKLLQTQHLEELPDQAHVRGALMCYNCLALKRARLEQVDGSCRFNGCATLESLVALNVGKELEVSLCPLLRECTFEKVGRLEMMECDLLRELNSDGFVVEGDARLGQYFFGARLRKAPPLTHWRSNFVVKGSASLNIPTLVELGAGMQFRYLDLRDCEVLEELPENLSLEQGLALSKCKKLRHIPDSVTVDHGDVIIESCTALESFPRAFERVNGMLNISNCKFIELPDGLTIVEDLLMDHCEELLTVPDSVSVGASVSMIGCVGLAELPLAFLKVKGNLTVSNCDFETLPENLEVDLDLRAQDMPNLQSLPESFLVGGSVYIDRCPNLTSLPECIFDWPPADNQHSFLRFTISDRHNIFMTGTGIPESFLDEVRERNPPHVQFHTSNGFGDGEGIGGLFSFGGIATGGDFGSIGFEKFETLEEAVRFWSDKAVDPDGPSLEEFDYLVIDPYISQENLRGVLLFLSKLRTSDEFANKDDEVQRSLAKRIVEVLELLAQDEYARDEIVARFVDAVDACGDKPIWALNQMTVLANIAHARGDREALRRIGLGIMRLDIVHDHVRKAIASAAVVDDVCFYLKFEVELKDSLDLPVSATSFLFPDYVKVTDDQLEAAREEALAITDEDLEDWLPSWTEWQRQLRHEVALELPDWADLPRNSRRWSASFLDLFGDEMKDPVRINAKGSVWSMKDLLKHWVATGLDLNNTQRSIAEMRAVTRTRSRSSLPRLSLPKRKSGGRPSAIAEEEEGADES